MLRMLYRKFTKKKKHTDFSDKALFFRRFINSPNQIGSVLPSSRYLVRSMLKGIDWDNVNTIAELGAGTAVLTKEIIKRAHPNTKILVFEIDPQLQKIISKHKHSGLIICDDAQKLTEVMKKEGIKKLDCVVSSLPFTVLPSEMTTCILNEITKNIKEDGIFVIYQYSNKMKNIFKSYFKNIKTSFVPLNIPPALIYECKKK